MLLFLFLQINQFNVFPLSFPVSQVMGTFSSCEDLCFVKYNGTHTGGVVMRSVASQRGVHGGWWMVEIIMSILFNTNKVN